MMQENKKENLQYDIITSIDICLNDDKGLIYDTNFEEDSDIFDTHYKSIDTTKDEIKFNDLMEYFDINQIKELNIPLRYNTGDGMILIDINNTDQKFKILKWKK
jgi:hypothetical protein